MEPPREATEPLTPEGALRLNQELTWLFATHEESASKLLPADLDADDREEALQEARILTGEVLAAKRDFTREDAVSIFETRVAKAGARAVQDRRDQEKDVVHLDPDYLDTSLGEERGGTLVSDDSIVGHIGPARARAGSLVVELHDGAEDGIRSENAAKLEDEEQARLELARSEINYAVADAVETLPRRQRQEICLWLPRNDEGEPLLDNAQIGAIMGITESAVRAHHALALSKLRKLLAPFEDLHVHDPRLVKERDS